MAADAGTGRTAQLSPEQQELCAATRALVGACGGQEASAAFAGKRRQAISDWCLPNVASFAPVDFVAALEGLTVGLPGHPHVTRVLARRAGYLLVPMIGGAGPRDPLHGLAAIGAEFGDLSRCIGEANDDGKFCAADRKAAAKALFDLEVEVAALRVAMESAA